jgi:hypothetical protein
MQISTVTTYRIDVTQEEFNLIGLALCGRLKPEQIEAAAELNRRLLEGRGGVPTWITFNLPTAPWNL